jgi:hypothetical protein
VTPTEGDGGGLLSAAQARALVVADVPGYPVGGAYEDATHYGFGCGGDPLESCGAAYPLVDKRTGRVEWLGNLEGVQRLSAMARTSR